MADTSVFRVGAVGAVLEVQFVTAAGAPDDVSSASGAGTKKIRIMRQGAASAKEFSAVFSTDGTDGKIRYVTASANDLNVEGVWLIQGYVSVTGPWSGWGPIGTFEVGEVLGPVEE